jgi:hypothetical protein
MCSYVDAQTLPLINISFHAGRLVITTENSETAGEVSQRHTLEVSQRHTPEERIA